MLEINLSASRYSTPERTRTVSACLAALLTLYAFTRILQILPFSTPSTPIVALEVLSALAFALVHGAQHYRLRGILVFTAICLVIGNIIESIGVLTGFPYGHYEFLPLMGPQLNRVPILLGLAYIGMAYVSWTLARLILTVTAVKPAGPQLITLPLLAAVIMTVWDVAQDPVWSTLLHGWRWRDGGLWFGVPLTNYAGWLLTVFLIYFIKFAWDICADPRPHPSPHPRAGAPPSCSTPSALSATSSSYFVRKPWTQSSTPQAHNGTPRLSSAPLRSSQFSSWVRSRSLPGLAFPGPAPQRFPGCHIPNPISSSRRDHQGAGNLA